MSTPNEQEPKALGLQDFWLSAQVGRTEHCANQALGRDECFDVLAVAL
jgi:hypothetical protein